MLYSLRKMDHKIQLIRPPLDPWYTVSQIHELVSIPTGLCVIARNLKDFTGVKVSIFDGMNLSMDKVLDKIDGDFVGVSDMYPTHQNSLSILKKAKKLGAKTVIGGPNVNYLAERILRNNDFIDYVIVGDGEEALPELLHGEENTPNLVYRRNGKIIKNKRKNAELTIIFDLDDIINPPKNLEKLIIPISAIRGCSKAEEKGRCVFCSIDHTLELMHPELVWEQIRLFYERYGIKYIFESGDSFFVGNYPQKLLETRPDDLKHIGFTKVYASSDQITEQRADLLKELNTKYVFLGIESPVDNILASSGKSYTRDDIDKAIKILTEKDISLHVSFMYGLKGETPETMNKTFEFAKHLVETDPDIQILASLTVPLPGSRLFSSLIPFDEEYIDDLKNDDTFDYQSLVRLHLKHHTKVSYKHALEMVEKTRALAKEGSRTSFDINK